VLEDAADGLERRVAQRAREVVAVGAGRISFGLVIPQRDVVDLVLIRARFAAAGLEMQDHGRGRGELLGAAETLNRPPLVRSEMLTHVRP
jgi:hypothetical protein